MLLFTILSVVKIELCESQNEQLLQQSWALLLSGFTEITSVRLAEFLKGRAASSIEIELAINSAVDQLLEALKISNSA